MPKTNQQKLQDMYNLLGETMFNLVIQAVGPGTISIPKDVNRARRKTRDEAIKADFYSAEYADLKNMEAYKVLGEKYNLSPDRIRNIIKNGSRFMP